MSNLIFDLIRSLRLCTVAAALLCVSVGISRGECSPAVQPAFSTINSMLMLVGKNSAGTPDNQGLWTATFRSNTNAPIVGALVQIKWEQGTGPGGYNYSVCNTQTYPGVTYSKAGLTHIFSTTTDNTGTARMILMGAHVPGVNCPDVQLGAWQRARVFVCGTEINIPGATGLITVTTPNLDGSGGVGSNDFSYFFDDYACSTGPNSIVTRSDFDNSGSVSANDLSFLLTIYGAGGSSSGCP